MQVVFAFKKDKDGTKILESGAPWKTRNALLESGAPWKTRNALKVGKCLFKKPTRFLPALAKEKGIRNTAAYTGAESGLMQAERSKP